MTVSSKECKKCREKNNPTFSACWKCGTPFESPAKKVVDKPAPKKRERPQPKAVSPKHNPPFFRYSENAFYILGVSATATGQEVMQRVQEAKVYAKLGSSVKFSNDIPSFGVIGRDENKIRAAQHKIENLKNRLLDEVFWFWDVDEESKSALHALIKNDADQARKLWQQIILNGASEQEKVVALHNDIVYRHASLLRAESESVSLEERHWEEWKKVVEDWMNLLSKETFWEYMRNREIEVGGMENAKIIEELKRECFLEVIKANEELVAFYSQNNEIDAVAAHASVIHDVKLPGIYRKRILDSVLDKAEDEISSAVRRWQREFNELEDSLDDKEALISCCNQIREQLKKKLDDPLKLLTALDIDGTSDAALAAEGYAELLRNLAIKVSNEAKKHNDAKELVIEARKYANNVQLQQQLDKDLSDLEILTLVEDIKSGTPKSASDGDRTPAEHSEQVGNNQSSDRGARQASENDKTKTGKSYSVTVPGNQIMIPQECNCCLADGESKDHLSHEYERGNTKHTVTLELNVCKACEAHRSSLTIKMLLLFFIAVGAGIGWAYCLMKVWPFVSVELFSSSTAIFSLIVYLMSNKLLPFKEIDEGHGSSDDSAKIISSAGGMVTLEFTNAKYAKLFAVSNGRDVRLVSRWAHARKKVFSVFSKSFIIGLIWVAAVLTVGLWFFWDGMAQAWLYVDNGYGRTITVDLQDGAMVSDAKPGITRIKVPVTKVSAQVRERDNLIGEYSLNINSGGTWLFNPGKKNSYARMEVEYGNTSREPKDRNLGNPLLIKVDVDYMFKEPPKSISTKSSGEIRSALIRLGEAEDFFVPDNLQSLRDSIEDQERRIERGQQELAEMEMRINNYRNRMNQIEAGGYVPDHMTQEYNILADKGNQEIENYNSKLNYVKQLQEKYNNDIERYNAQL